MYRVLPMWQNLVTFVITTKQIKRFKNPIPMSKDISLISEIDKYFKNNDATSAMNKIMEITRTLNFSERKADTIASTRRQLVRMCRGHQVRYFPP